MGNKSKKPPVRNSSVKVFTRDESANFTSQSSESSSSGGSTQNECWSFELIELSVSPDDLQINDPVSADVISGEVTVYNNDGKRLGKAPADKAKQISKAAELKDEFSLFGKITGKTSTEVKVKICFK